MVMEKRAATRAAPTKIGQGDEEVDWMESRVRSAYVDIVERRALEGGLYRVTIAANERVRQRRSWTSGGCRRSGT